MRITDEELATLRALDEAQAAQERLHLADPQHVPFYLPADAPGFETQAWTAGGPEEPDA